MQRWATQVWQEDLYNPVFHINKQRQHKLALQSCGGKANLCRTALKTLVQKQCRDRITELGDLFGRDRMAVHTVAFGPPGDDYAVLEEMARVLPRGSFQKLGLSASGLRTAFSSLSSSLTTLRTDGAGEFHPRNFPSFFLFSLVRPVRLVLPVCIFPASRICFWKIVRT